MKLSFSFNKDLTDQARLSTWTTKQARGTSSPCFTF